MLMAISYAFLGLIDINNNLLYFLYFNFIISMISIFSLRGIFYSLLKEIKLPASITGIAVGIISFIGYMPDIFIGPIFGYFLDKSNPLHSFQYCFLLLLVLSSAGFVASLFLKKQKN